MAARLHGSPAMSVRRTLDRRPGSVPEIRALGEDLTFQFEIAGLPERIKLRLRCDASGEVLASVASGPDRSQRERTAD